MMTDNNKDNSEIKTPRNLRKKKDVTLKSAEGKVADTEALGGPESSPNVFILPPDLLRQLGIQLGAANQSVGSANNDGTHFSPATAYNINIKDHGKEKHYEDADNIVPCKGNSKFLDYRLLSNHLEKKYNELDSENYSNHISEKSSSIMETVTLMKESLLLSPSFELLSNNQYKSPSIAKCTNTSADLSFSTPVSDCDSQLMSSQYYSSPDTRVNRNSKSNKLKVNRYNQAIREPNSDSTRANNNKSFTHLQSQNNVSTENLLLVPEIAQQDRLKYQIEKHSNERSSIINSPFVINEIEAQSTNVENDSTIIDRIKDKILIESNEQSIAESSSVVLDSELHNDTVKTFDSFSDNETHSAFENNYEQDNEQKQHVLMSTTENNLISANKQNSNLKTTNFSSSTKKENVKICIISDEILSSEDYLKIREKTITSPLQSVSSVKNEHIKPEILSNKNVKKYDILSPEITQRDDYDRQIVHSSLNHIKIIKTSIKEPTVNSDLSLNTSRLENIVLERLEPKNLVASPNDKNKKDFQAVVEEKNRDHSLHAKSLVTLSLDSNTKSTLTDVEKKLKCNDKMISGKKLKSIDDLQFHKMPLTGPKSQLKCPISKIAEESNSNTSLVQNKNINDSTRLLSINKSEKLDSNGSSKNVVTDNTPCISSCEPKNRNKESLQSFRYSNITSPRGSAEAQTKNWTSYTRCFDDKMLGTKLISDSKNTNEPHNLESSNFNQIFNDTPSTPQVYTRKQGSISTKKVMKDADNISLIAQYLKAAEQACQKKYNIDKQNPIPHRKNTKNRYTTYNPQQKVINSHGVEKPGGLNDITKNDITNTMNSKKVLNVDNGVKNHNKELANDDRISVFAHSGHSKNDLEVPTVVSSKKDLGYCNEQFINDKAFSCSAGHNQDVYKKSADLQMTTTQPIILQTKCLDSSSCAPSQKSTIKKYANDRKICEAEAKAQSRESTSVSSDSNELMLYENIILCKSPNVQPKTYSRKSTTVNSPFHKATKSSSTPLNSIHEEVLLDTRFLGESKESKLINIKQGSLELESWKNIGHPSYNNSSPGQTEKIDIDDIEMSVNTHNAIDNVKLCTGMVKIFDINLVDNSDDANNIHIEEDDFIDNLDNFQECDYINNAIQTNQRAMNCENDFNALHTEGNSSNSQNCLEITMQDKHTTNAPRKFPQSNIGDGVSIQTDNDFHVDINDEVSDSTDIHIRADIEGVGNELLSSKMLEGTVAKVSNSENNEVQMRKTNEVQKSSQDNIGIDDNPAKENFEDVFHMDTVHNKSNIKNASDTSGNNDNSANARNVSLGSNHTLLENSTDCSKIANISNITKKRRGRPRKKETLPMNENNMQESVAIPYNCPLPREKSLHDYKGDELSTTMGLLKSYNGNAAGILTDNLLHVHVNDRVRSISHIDSQAQLNVSVNNSTDNDSQVNLCDDGSNESNIQTNSAVRISIGNNLHVDENNGLIVGDEINNKSQINNCNSRSILLLNSINNFLDARVEEVSNTEKNEVGVKKSKKERVIVDDNLQENFKDIIHMDSVQDGANIENASGTLAINDNTTNAENVSLVTDNGVAKTSNITKRKRGRPRKTEKLPIKENDLQESVSTPYNHFIHSRKSLPVYKGDNVSQINSCSSLSIPLLNHKLLEDRVEKVSNSVENEVRVEKSCADSICLDGTVEHNDHTFNVKNSLIVSNDTLLDNSTNSPKITNMKKRCGRPRKKEIMPIKKNCLQESASTPYNRLSPKRKSHRLSKSLSTLAINESAVKENDNLNLTEKSEIDNFSKGKSTVRKILTNSLDTMGQTDRDNKMSESIIELVECSDDEKLSVTLTKKKASKRKRQISSTSEEEPTESKTGLRFKTSTEITAEESERGQGICAICLQVIENSSWSTHRQQHNDLAWRQGEPAIDLTDSQMVYGILLEKQRRTGNKVFECDKCGVRRLSVTGFMSHLSICQKKKDEINASKEECPLCHNLYMPQSIKVHSQTCRGSMKNKNEIMDGSEPPKKRLKRVFEIRVDEPPAGQEHVKCAVCSESIPSSLWEQHLRNSHYYLAWFEGGTALDLTDENYMIAILNRSLKSNKVLVCYLCGEKRVSAIGLISHNAVCQKTEQEIEDMKLTCEVCKRKVMPCSMKVHMAAHVVRQVPADTSTDTPDTPDTPDTEEPAMLNKSGRQMRKAAKKAEKTIERLKSHGSIVVDSSKINIKDMYTRPWSGVVHHIRAWHWQSELLSRGQRRCPHEGCSHISVTIDDLMTHHTICTHRQTHYLCNNCDHKCENEEDMEEHVRKHIDDVEKDKNFDISATFSQGLEKMYKPPWQGFADPITIEEWNKELSVNGISSCPNYGCDYSNVSQGEILKHYEKECQHHSMKYTCKMCNEQLESEDQVKLHVMVQHNYQEQGELSASESSGSSSGEESTESEFSDVSDIEEKPKRDPHKKKLSKVISNNPNKAIVAENHCATTYNKWMNNLCDFHFAKDVLYHEWACPSYESVPAVNIDLYLPPMKQSCNIAHNTVNKVNAKMTKKAAFKTYKLFEGDPDLEDSMSFFVGGAVTSLSWLPVATPEAACSAEDAPVQHLAVCTQRDADADGLDAHASYSHPGLIQIWVLGPLHNTNKKYTKAASFVLGIAHDYGTVWSLDWCPSGGEECVKSSECGSSESLKGTPSLRRMGLLAAACSNGSVYIFAVCHPKDLPDKLFPIYKTTPVVELRLMDPKVSTVQATCVHWSLEKGHNIVVVGYSEGTVALFNLCSRSVLLRSVSANTVLLAPYYTSQLLHNHVTGLFIYPRKSSASDRGTGVLLGAASYAFVGVWSRVGVGEPREVLIRKQNASTMAVTPHWPSLLVSIDDPMGKCCGVEFPCRAWIGSYLADQIEEHRRVQSGGGEGNYVTANWWSGICAHATNNGAVTLTSQLHPHLKQRIFKIHVTICQLLQLPKKEDSKSMLEVETYADCTKEFGLVVRDAPAWDHYQLSTDCLRGSDLGRLPVSRYPLSSVTRLAFCPAFAAHAHLAQGMQCGLVHVTNIRDLQNWRWCSPRRGK